MSTSAKAGRKTANSGILSRNLLHKRSQHCVTRPEFPCQAATQDVPMSAKVVTSIIDTSSVPFTSYIPHPRTPLHFIDARVKQLWLITLLVLIPRVPWEMRVSAIGLILLLTVVCLPARLWKAQLSRLGLLCGFLFVATALTADQSVTSVASTLPPSEVSNLPSLQNLNSGYRYVIFKLLFVTVSRFSLSLGLTVAATAFAGLQLTSLFLVTTPPEQMALAFKWFAAPLRLLGAPIDKITFMLLLSLRFISLVFEEVRNLCLGIAARGVRWQGLSFHAQLAVWATALVKLFSNLFARSRYIAESLIVRGYDDPEKRHLNIPKLLKSSYLANSLSMLLLVACVSWTMYRHWSV